VQPIIVKKKETQNFNLNIVQPIIVKKKETQKIKQQIFKTAALPAGVPELIYHYPEQYGGQKFGIKVTEEQLLEVLEEMMII